MVKLYVPAGSPDIVVLFPVPVKITVPGYRVSVHMPVSINPFNSTLPVDSSQDGWVILPTAGGGGIAGWAFITTAEDTAEVHPDEFVTVNK